MSSTDFKPVAPGWFVTYNGGSAELVGWATHDGWTHQHPVIATQGKVMMLRELIGDDPFAVKTKGL